jgi:hypothetical protein
MRAHSTIVAVLAASLVAGACGDTSNPVAPNPEVSFGKGGPIPDGPNALPSAAVSDSRPGTASPTTTVQRQRGRVGTHAAHLQRLRRHVAGGLANEAHDLMPVAPPVPTNVRWRPTRRFGRPRLA